MCADVSGALHPFVDIDRKIDAKLLCHLLSLNHHSPGDGSGARVSVRVGASTQVREVRRGGSYLSSHDPRVHFGLGVSTRVDEVEIRWPSGVVQQFESVEAGQILTVEEIP